MRTLYTAIILAASGLLATGCGDNGPPPGAPYADPSPVTGTVRLADGSPLKGGIIVFTPVQVNVGSKIRYPGEAFVDTKGQFTAGLANSGNGLVPGEYKVSVKKREIGELKDTNIGRVAAEFTDPGSTKITVNIEAKSNTLDITLK